MASTGQNRIRIFGISSLAATAVLPPHQAQHRRWLGAVVALAMGFVLTIAATPAANAQTFQVIHIFTGGLDGAQSHAGLTMDRAGNLYGTTAYGNVNAGTVFKLSRRGSAWLFSPLYEFTGGSDGAYPDAGVIVGPDGNVYGTTYTGGTFGDFCEYQYCGTVYRLMPPAAPPITALSPWTETVLYSFAGGNDGANPSSTPVFDANRNLYITTQSGGVGCVPYGCGTVIELTPTNGSWTERILYSFQGGNDGQQPVAGLTFDQVHNLYGTTIYGGDGDCGCGAVFQLMYSGSAWSENVLHNFQGSDGAGPWGGVIFDQSGNLYGTTMSGGPGNPAGGTAFELTPSSGRWAYTLVYGFNDDLDGPYGGLTLDAAGNLYGMTSGGGTYQQGEVFKLTRSTNGWTLTTLHDFTGGNDGGDPFGDVLIDANGNLYGTTAYGGSYSEGVVWEITP
ncbi:MAG: choice-of-anchor tandem repeat GloVer-containing protein [Candidatus Korobacteraceae bacterium]